ncbi:GNAT family N-acetyltransferase [soil metagenome]
MVEYTTSGVDYFAEAAWLQCTLRTMNEPPVTVRPATNRDASAVCELIFAILHEYQLPPDPTGADADLDDIEANYFARGGRFDVLIDAGGSVVGTVGLYPINDRTVELRKMYVHARERGKGHGLRLLNHAIESARRLGFKRMTLETASQLKTAIDMYKRRGLRPMSGEIHVRRCDQAYEMEL